MTKTDESTASSRRIDSASAPLDPREAVCRLLRKQVWSIIALVALQIISSLASLAPLLAIIELGRTLLTPGADDLDQVRLMVFIGIGGLLVRLIFAGAAVALGHAVDSRTQFALRLRLAATLGKAPLIWLIRRKSGELSKVVGDDVSALHPAIAHTPAQLVDAFVVPAVSLTYLIFLDWRMALITLIPVLIAIAMVPLMITPSKLSAEREFDAAMSRLRNSLVELVRGIRVVKVFGGPDGTGLRFNRSAEDFVSSFQRWVRGMAGPAAAMQLALSPPVMILAVLIGGSTLIASGRLPAVDILPFLLLGLGLAAPVAALGHGFDDLQAARRATSRIREVLSIKPLPVPEETAVPDGSRVEFRDVQFVYDQHQVLDGVDLVIEPGTTTAIVGPSGSGKSTLVHLLLRFADPTQGTVTVGGVDLRDLDAEMLNRNVVAVLQDAQMIRATIADNIAISVPEAEEEKIVGAARLANIHDRIVALPRGYQSIVGEDAQLSGGEIQRVALARALLSQVSVLILDEATSSADPVTERAIRDAMMAADSTRTTVIIAHRRETIARADQVVVLDGGKIVEAGSPNQLSATENPLAAIWEAPVAAVAEGGEN
jgi:ATP-binding cassette subfamily B protein IrtA